MKNIAAIVLMLTCMIGCSPEGRDYAEYKDLSPMEEWLKKDDQIFMFSDGVNDQKGGVEGKKLYFRNFEKILIEMSKMPVSEQVDYLSAKMTDWQGDLEQLDDMLVFGWKVN